MESKYLPKFKDVLGKSKLDRTKLEWFIYNHQPMRQDSDFRKSLIEILNEHQKEIHWEENP